MKTEKKSNHQFLVFISYSTFWVFFFFFLLDRFCRYHTSFKQTSNYGEGIYPTTFWTVINGHDFSLRFKICFWKWPFSYTIFRPAFLLSLALSFGFSLLVNIILTQRAYSQKKRDKVRKGKSENIFLVLFFISLLLFTQILLILYFKLCGDDNFNPSRLSGFVVASSQSSSLFNKKSKNGERCIDFFSIFLFLSVYRPVKPVIRVKYRAFWCWQSPELCYLLQTVNLLFALVCVYNE